MQMYWSLTIQLTVTSPQAFSGHRNPPTCLYMERLDQPIILELQFLKKGYRIFFFVENSPLGNADQDRRSSIEIAIEKRCMESMNEGFQSLGT